MKTTFTLNGETVQVDTPADANLLWTLREKLKLTGTKYGCGESICGICTVHLDGASVRSCTTPMTAVSGRTVVTIEGLSTNNDHPLQRAFIQEQVPQCGYCQPGQIMQAAALLERSPKPSRDEIIGHMNGIICRCGTYLRIIKAIENAANEG